jgi:hypothetical protein
MPKRNAALEALGKTPVVTAPRTVEPKPKPTAKFARVMLYLPPPVAKAVKQIALDTNRKPHDVFVDALQSWLRSNGHTRQADMLARRHGSTAVR